MRAFPAERSHTVAPGKPFPERCQRTPQLAVWVGRGSSTSDATDNSNGETGSRKRQGKAAGIETGSSVDWRVDYQVVTSAGSRDKQASKQAERMTAGRLTTSQLSN